MIYAKQYLGRLGNMMFQYASLYALSKKTDLYLNVPIIKEFNTQENITGSKKIETEKKIILPVINGNYINYAKLNLNNLNQTVVTGSPSHLENIYNFQEYRDDLINIFTLPNYSLDQYTFFLNSRNRYENVVVNDIDKDDLVISLRLGDFIHPPIKYNPPHRLLTYDYFSTILSNIKFNRLFITSDEPLHPFVNEFRHLNPIIVQNDNPIKTMSLVRRFKKIAISQSTYSWWCGYLSNASEIYYPIPKSGPWSIKTEFSVNALYLREHTDRYFYVHEKSGEIYNWKDAPGRRDYDDF